MRLHSKKRQLALGTDGRRGWEEGSGGYKMVPLSDPASLAVGNLLSDHVRIMASFDFERTKIRPQVDGVSYASYATLVDLFDP